MTIQDDAIVASTPTADLAASDTAPVDNAPVVETNTAAASEAFAADAPMAIAPASPPEASPLSLVYGQDSKVADWIAKQLGGDTSFDQPRAIGIERSGELVAGAVYTHFSGRNICITICATVPDWADQAIIKGLLAYPLVQLGCHRLTAVIPVVAPATVSFAEQLGFVVEGRCREAFPGKIDGVVCGLLASDAKARGWI